MWEQIGGTFLAKVVTEIWDQIRRRSSRDGIRIETTLERGPISREHGFTETAIKITVVNETKSTVKIRDIRLMFCGAFGTSVAPKAPLGLEHPELPVNLYSGTEKNWYVPAEKLSQLLRSLHHPPTTTVPATRTVTLHARCITGTGKVYKSSAFLFPTDPNAHWG